MKADISRNTFAAHKHYSSVRMQQGRVQLDADWNEQGEIVFHRIETEALDIIGKCGGPLHTAAFHIVSNANDLTPEEKNLPGNEAEPKNVSPNFLISAGRYYVDGILCENERLCLYTEQPDLPDAEPIKDAGWYVAYVDVWQRHLTALDDPQIRETALGGPDTATRTKTLWQIKYWLAEKEINGKPNCLTKFEEFEKLLAPSDGKLSAKTKAEKASPDPCIVPPSAGYRGLENQLYRVEIHQGGTALDLAGAAAGTAIKKISADAEKVPNQIQVSGGKWQVGQTVEIYASKPGSHPMNGVLASITAIDPKTNTLTLNRSILLTLDNVPRLRAAGATFKWSRDNGAVVTAILSIKENELTVHDLGPDANLGFGVGQWVEISDDALELNGQPGQLVQIVKVDPAINLITLSSVPALLSPALDDGVDPVRHPKLRRWDGIGAVKFHTPASADDLLDLESGIQITFFKGRYRTGDYWTIPARTATADAQSGKIEWPQIAADQPQALEPFGIRHHYCKLALLHWNGEVFDVVEDCRNLFPPVTELTSLCYVGGDGQEAMPDPTQPPASIPLPQLLMVGVANGRWPVANAKVRFQVEDDNGKPLPPPAPQGGTQVDDKTVDVRTDEHGLARCVWRIDSDKQSQQLKARLFDADDKPVHLPVVFTANLSVASHVSYDPAKCPNLAAAKVSNVQDAIDHLCQVQHGGGCSVTVGKGGQFETLDKAIAALLAEKRTDICICLMPGEQELSKRLVIKDLDEKNPVTHVKIEGCGLGSRLNITGAELVVGPLASFTLRDVAVLAQESQKPIQFPSCREIVIEGCSLSTGILGPTDLITIDRADLVRISNNTLSSLWHGGLQTTTIKELNLTRPDPFAMSSLSSIVEDMVETLSRVKPEVRQQFIEKYQNFIRTDQTLTDSARKNIDKATQVIARIDQRETTDERVVEAVALLFFGNTLIFKNGDADTLIENNRFIGRVLLYGDEDWFSDTDWKRFASSIQKGEVNLVNPAGVLHIRNNLLTGISISNSILRRVVTLPTGKKELSGLYGRLLFGENCSRISLNQLLAHHLNLSSSLFNLDHAAKFEAATIAGRSAIAIGNSAPDPTSPLFLAIAPPPSNIAVPPSSNLLNVAALP
jgi:hypothetical protein